LSILEFTKILFLSLALIFLMIAILENADTFAHLRANAHSYTYPNGNNRVDVFIYGNYSYVDYWLWGAGVSVVIFIINAAAINVLKIKNRTRI
jgi:hypothetical protein